MGLIENFYKGVKGFDLDKRSIGSMQRAAGRPLKKPGKTSNADNYKVPATVNELLSTMQVVPSAYVPAALAI